MLNPLKKKARECKKALLSVWDKKNLVLDPRTGTWVHRRVDSKCKNTLLSACKNTVWTFRWLLFENKREFAHLLIGIYAWIFLLLFFYALATSTLWDVASELSHNLGKLLGLPYWFVGILKIVTVILGIVYLYRFLRSLGEDYYPRGFLPLNMTVVPEIEKALSAWKGRSISELVDAIGPPASQGFTPVKDPGQSVIPVGHNIYMWKDVPAELLGYRGSRFRIRFTALTFCVYDIGNRIVFYSWAWDGRKLKEDEERDEDF